MIVGQQDTRPLTLRPLILALLASVAAVPATGATAFELFGIRLFGDQADEDAAAVIAEPQGYAVTFSTGSATGELESAIRGASQLLADESEPASGAAGLIAKARGDYRRILGALQQQGYYGGAISILIAGREAANLPPDTRLPDPAPVTVTVDPGPEFRFERVTISNRAPLTDDPDDIVDPPESVGYGRGEVAKAGVILRAEQLALEAWRQQGFARATVVSRDVVADHRTRQVDVAILIDPGRRAFVGPVSVTGAQAVDPGFIAEQTGLRGGDEYDPDDVRRAERRLMRLEAFRAMRVEPAERISDTGLLPFTVTVEELPGRRFGAGATFSTVDGLGIEGYHLWRNVFGRAERLRLDAKIAGIGFPVSTADFDYAFGGTFTKPGFPDPDTDLIAAIAAERTVLPAYTETSANARLGATHYLLDTTTIEGAAFYEFARFEDSFGTRDFSLVGLSGTATFDNRDEPLDATEGFYAQATVEPFYEFFYGNPAFRTTAEVRAYWGVSADPTVVLAARAKLGALVGPPIEEAPPDRLFFAGGGGSVRGYAYRGIGVDGPGGTVTGGRYLMEGSVEARARLMGDFGAVAFLDAGAVTAEGFPGVDDIRFGAGIGLRYFTGLGPLRLDLAFPLNKREGDPDYALYVGIGQAF
ncbi:autotransporter secretion outer membrane protein TamA [Devosia enhydra]|uniref:Autotransporter secretion outer membrane protein TamA n=1 Tax=Devosia enhydra TaxID=665118 RepID=A0A1K2I1T3_9HYPH|nr:autotransporter assembly complex family protein [Devosia enhydra]SFZ86341.1 autotransporter secretion outer membrane protein TamA [Devosia enhydra]